MKPRTSSSALLLGAIVLLGTATRASAQADFAIGSLVAKPGTLASGAFDIPARGAEVATTIPFSVIHGTKPGPVLAIIAGVHGAEYTPILALHRLRAAVNPATLTGTIVLVHVANMPSFLGRTIYYSPVDGKNLNRVFPGAPNGTVSERIADVLTREVIARATHVIDAHCGDGNESLRPYSYWTTTGPDAVAAAGKEMALAAGFDHIVVDRERPTDPGATVYLSNTAILRGKPAITIESGFLASTDEASVAAIERAAAGVMRWLGMRPNGPAPVAHPVWIERSEVLRSDVTGMFQPAVERGHTVAAGTLIGRITDFHGTLLREVRAPFAGEVLYVIATPPISKGEPLAFIGQAAH
jgi:hypothetical protein